MKTFLEYISAHSKTRSLISDEEAKFLLRVRDRLSSSGYKESLKDFTGKLINPYLWIPLPDDLGGGIRVYLMFGSLLLRAQKSPDSPPLGLPIKVDGVLSKKSKQDGVWNDEGDVPDTSRLLGTSSDTDLDPDPVSLDKLPGAIKTLIADLRRKRLDAAPDKKGNDRGFNTNWVNSSEE